MKLLNLIILTLCFNFTYSRAETLTGAGATFPYPIYSKWFSDFKKANPNSEINYQSIGSGGGIRQLIEGTVDFGASDAPMTDEQLQKSKTPILHFPTVLGAVVLSYNLAEVTKPLNLSAQTVSEIYLGKITQWNDAKIAADNKGVTLPDKPIMVIYRSDGSGTTAVFTDYLSKVSPQWKSTVGAGTAIKWPAGIGSKGNEGVSGTIKQSPGSLGYIELVYAETNKLAYANLKNTKGVFVKPGNKSVTAAASGSLKTMPKDFRISITNAEHKDAYPISSFTYLLVYSAMPENKLNLFKDFLTWAYKDGQSIADKMGYAPLPAGMLKNIKVSMGQLEVKK